MLFSTHLLGIVLKLYFLVFITFSLLSATEAFACWQCGTYHRGQRDICDASDKVRYNCSACLKSYTRAYLHDSWTRYQYTEKVSKTCVPKHGYKKSAGCYTKTTASGYMRQCYCYGEMCNTASTYHYNFILPLGLISLVILFT